MDAQDPEGIQKAEELGNININQGTFDTRTPQGNYAANFESFS